MTQQAIFHSSRPLTSAELVRAIDDPAAHYKGKTIQVKGKVKLYRERPEIAVSGPDQIEIVEKK